MNENQPQSVAPPPEVFERKQISNEQLVLSTGEAMHIFTGRIDVPPEGGMYLWFKDVPFPKKGFPYPDAAFAANIVKRQTIMVLLSLARKEIILPAIGFALLPYKKKISFLENFLEQYYRNADYMLGSHFLKEEYLSPCAHELYKVLNTFLIELGVNTETAHRASKILSLLVELDNTYRYRLEDIMSEMTKSEFIDNPRQALKKIVRIVSEREKVMDGTFIAGKKFIAFANIASYITFHPRFKKAFVKAFFGSIFYRFQLDEADRYHVLMRDDYNYMGKSQDERIALYKEFHLRSSCCDKKVVAIYSDDWKEMLSTTCSECKKLCGIIEEYPPMVQYQF